MNPGFRAGNKYHLQSVIAIGAGSLYSGGKLNSAAECDFARIESSPSSDRAPNLAYLDFGGLYRERKVVLVLVHDMNARLRIRTRGAEVSRGSARHLWLRRRARVGNPPSCNRPAYEARNFTSTPPRAFLLPAASPPPAIHVSNFCPASFFVLPPHFTASKRLRAVQSSLVMTVFDLCGESK